MFDWKIPDEWLIKNAYIMNSKGKKIIDFKENNLHVLGYSTPINKTITYAKLENIYILFQNFHQPYLMSPHIMRDDGVFCVSHKQKLKLKKKKNLLEF